MLFNFIHLLNKNKAKALTYEVDEPLHLGLCDGKSYFLLSPFIIQSVHYKTISTTYVANLKSYTV
jgi:hypothetical protein